MKRGRPQWLISAVAAVLLLGYSYGAAAEIFGNYECQDRVGLRELKISKWQEPGGIKFDIRMQVEAENRFGGMSGVADLQGNTATYSDRDKECPLTITFQGNRAVVKAPGCRDHYGALPLSGVYLKK